MSTIKINTRACAIFSVLSAAFFILIMGYSNTARATEGEICYACEGGLLSLSLIYGGDTAAVIEVIEKNGDELTLFGPQEVAPNEEFQINSSDGNRMRNTIFIYVNGVKLAEFHVSCSQPIGPGTTSGDFTVTQAISRDNGEVCPNDGTTPPPVGCVDCSGGLISLSLIYGGDTGAVVEVIEKGNKGVTLFGPQYVSPNEEFQINSSDGDRMRNTLFIYVDGVKSAEFHVSCSQPIGPGTTSGDFTVAHAISRDLGEAFCPTTEFDYGDAPLSYGDAWHMILATNNPYIGDNPPDAEAGTPPTDIDALGDDFTNLDDEGATVLGLPFNQTLICGGELITLFPYNLIVPVTGAGFLNVWADWNSNGVFEETDEHIVFDAQPVAGQVVATFMMPEVIGIRSDARFRFSSEAGLGPNGLAADGEVEDCFFDFSED